LLKQEVFRCWVLIQSPGIKTKTNNDLVKIKISQWVNPIAILGLKETFRNDIELWESIELFPQQLAIELFPQPAIELSLCFS
jgi:hypothetical protein